MEEVIIGSEDVKALYPSLDIFYSKEGLWSLLH